MKPSPGSVPAIRLECLTKRFGAATDTAAVEGIDLEVGDGEFFSDRKSTRLNSSH